MKLVIDRSKWLRGEGAGTSYLIRESDGKMCCLGFFGLACGIDASDMENRQTPSDTGKSLRLRAEQWPEWLLSYYEHADVEGVLMEENDEDANEDRIAAIFGEHGVVVEFIDGEDP